ncbi:MAG: hypothetical protein HY046_14735 [Acidobacteria bacterium]|nr:hypothetical protein [Acidobacteriota bacterium]
MALTKIISALRRRYGRPKPPLKDPLALILWENVIYLGNDEKRAAAYAALKKKIGLSPQKIIDASNAQLLEITRMGSVVPEISAKKLRLISELAHYIFKDDLKSILKKPMKQAIKDLRKFPSIGEPSAKKILLFTGAAPILALESNGLRVLRRIGYGEKNYSAMYKCVQDAVSGELPKSCKEITEIHQLLRQHGQELCKTNRPLCDACPVSRDCEYFKCSRSG